WKKFNERFLRPRRIFGTLQVIQYKGRKPRYLIGIYKAERIVKVNPIGNHDIEVFLGRKLSISQGWNPNGFSPRGKNLVIIDLARIDEITENRMKIMGQTEQDDESNNEKELVKAANR